VPNIKVGDINIHYEIEGKGKPLLMISGFGAQLSAWSDEFISSLKPHFQLILFENRGCGLTDKPDMEYSIPLLADDAGGLLEMLGLKQIHVFGISMGGMIAQELALRHPRLVNGLILGGTYCGGPRVIPMAKEDLSLLEPVPGSSREDGIRRGLRTTVSPAFWADNGGFIDRMLGKALENPAPEYVLSRQGNAIMTFDTYDRLPYIKTPTLIIHGEVDLIPSENSRLLHEHIPNSQLLIMPGAGHVFYWEKPKETTEAITKFLSSLPD